jgi:D-lactate dehydrogenase (cytochrome)
MLGSDAISTDDEDLLMHGYSEWSSINIDQLPVAVAYPKTTEEVSQIARVCHKRKVPMSKAYTMPASFIHLQTPVPYSGGSSLEANFSAPYGGMSIDFTFMDRIISLHADE